MRFLLIEEEFGPYRINDLAIYEKKILLNQLSGVTACEQQFISTYILSTNFMLPLQ